MPDLLHVPSAMAHTYPVQKLTPPARQHKQATEPKDPVKTPAMASARKATNPHRCGHTRLTGYARMPDINHRL